MKGFAKERNDETVGKLSFDEYHCHRYGMCSTQILVNPKVLDSNSKELKYCVSQQVPDSDEAKYEKNRVNIVAKQFRFPFNLTNFLKLKFKL